MNALLHNILISSNFHRVVDWVKLITITGAAQIIGQAVGFFCGLLVIRLLPTQEYALYTLANTMLGTMIILAEGGVSTGVLAKGGMVYQDRKQLGLVLSTGMYLRRKFAIFSLIIASPILLYLLIHHGANWYMSCVIILALIPAFYASLSATLLEIPFKLRQDVIPLQRIQIQSNLGRLVILSLFIFSFPFAYIALFATALPQLWANRRLKKESQKLVSHHEPHDPVIRNELLSIVKRILPGSVYFCISSQITIWILSIYGSTTSLAQLGALGRLSMIVTLFSMMFYTLVVPRFARLADDWKLLLRRYMQIQVALLILCISILGVVGNFSLEILWILGENYSNLSTQLLLLMSGTCLSFMVGASHYLCTSRGWVINPVVSIPINIASIVLGAIIIDISTLDGILILNIFVCSIQATMNILYTLFKIFTNYKLSLNA